MITASIELSGDHGHYTMTTLAGPLPGRVYKMLTKALRILEWEGCMRLQIDDDQQEPDTHAITNLLALVPTVTLFPSIMDQDDDELLGMTIGHELIHCRQGFWRIWWQNLIWCLLRRPGYPPVEEEAYNIVNIWVR